MDLQYVEYLLFNNDLTHNCPAQIVETQNWNALSLEDRANQRCDFAKIVVDDIEDNLENIEKDMNKRNSTAKFRGKKNKKSMTRKKREELSVSATKSIKKEKVEIVVRFD